MRTLFAFAVIAASVALATAAFSARTEVREITLVARGMAFYVEGQATANPVVHVRRGERVRITVRNVTAGILHDLAIDSLNVAMAPLNTGEVGSLDFTVPDRPGSYEYYCRPHALMMHGTLAVAD
jgi:plastocyanin